MPGEGFPGRIVDILQQTNYSKILGLHQRISYIKRCIEARIETWRRLTQDARDATFTPLIPDNLS